MEADTQPTAQEEERKLWSSCNMFYGTKATNFMCSKCFKDSQPDKPEATESKWNQLFLEDQKMEPNSEEKVVEEEKQPEKPIQVSNFGSFCIDQEEQMLEL